MERALDNAIVTDCPSPSTPGPPLLSPVVTLEDPPPAPRAVRRLSMGDQQAASSTPGRSPSPPLPASPAAEEPPASPEVYCSQYRMEEYERQNGPLPGHDKVGGWLRDVRAAYESDGPSFYPSPPAAPHKDQYVSDSENGRPRRRRQRSPPVTRIKDGVLYVHKEYQGQLPLCYYDTGLRENGQHDGYACFDMRDLQWARRVRFHIERMRDP